MAIYLTADEVFPDPGQPKLLVKLPLTVEQAGRAKDLIAIREYANTALKALDGAEYDLPAVEAVRLLASVARTERSLRSDDDARLAKLDAALASEVPESVVALCQFGAPPAEVVALPFRQYPAGCHKAAREIWRWFRQTFGAPKVGAGAWTATKEDAQQAMREIVEEMAEPHTWSALEGFAVREVAPPPGYDRAFVKDDAAGAHMVAMLNDDVTSPAQMEFEADLAALLNRHSAENGSNTPDFILGDFLVRCLHAFNRAVRERGGWFGRHDSPGVTATGEPFGGAVAETRVAEPDCIDATRYALSADQPNWQPSWEQEAKARAEENANASKLVTLLNEDLARLRTKNAALLEILRSLEWIWPWIGPADASAVLCPSCGNGKDDGHEAGCRLGLALAGKASGFIANEIKLPPDLHIGRWMSRDEAAKKWPNGGFSPLDIAPNLENYARLASPVLAWHLRKVKDDIAADAHLKDSVTFSMPPYEVVEEEEREVKPAAVTIGELEEMRAKAGLVHQEGSFTIGVDRAKPDAPEVHPVEAAKIAAAKEAGAVPVFPARLAHCPGCGVCLDKKEDGILRMKEIRFGGPDSPFSKCDKCGQLWEVRAPWYAGMSMEEAHVAIQTGRAPGKPGGAVTVPRGYPAWRMAADPLSIEPLGRALREDDEQHLKPSQ